jgi:hypothetical protein
MQINKFSVIIYIELTKCTELEYILRFVKHKA